MERLTFLMWNVSQCDYFSFSKNIVETLINYNGTYQAFEGNVTF